MNRYYGNIGDVWKHLVLAELLALEPPKHYWETHAGSASYPLTHSPDRDYGVYRFLEHGDSVVGTVRDTGKVTDLLARYPESFHAEVLDVTDRAAIREVVERSFARLGRIDVIVSNVADPGLSVPAQPAHGARGAPGGLGKGVGTHIH